LADVLSIQSVGFLLVCDQQPTPNVDRSGVFDMDTLVGVSPKCGVLSCGRESLRSIPCDHKLLNNPNARPAALRATSFNGTSFLCCHECRGKFSRISKWMAFSDINIRPGLLLDLEI
jgi:hypothetical protein